MALILKNPGMNPLGQFDALDSQLNTFKGGEVVTWVSTTWSGSDQSSADVTEDGYVGTTTKTRPAVALAGLASNQFPLFLSDDGINRYGTLFGAVVGGTVGQQANGPNSYTGVVLGPSTALGSGKVTCWDKPGLYGVTLDAVDNAANGLIPSTSATVGVGASLAYTSTGLLTPSLGGNKAGPSVTVGYMSEFQTTGSAVTTQQYMVAALNSPSGDVTSLQQQTFYQVEFWFIGGAA